MDKVAARFPGCKILHLVRHAEGLHNVEAKKNRDALMSYSLLDAELSSLGWQQVGSLRKHVQANGLRKRIELVITSPMLRTMQTAVGVFGSEGHISSLDTPTSTVANLKDDDNCTISTFNSLPMVAVELCRERLGVQPCNKRRSISKYRPLFPAVDFSLIESEEDGLWTADSKESHEEVADRGLNFIQWLWTRKEEEIAVVSHGIFLQQTLIALGNKCYTSLKSEQFKRFDNCELRSVIIYNETKMGLDYLTARCCEKIPNGLEFPSEAAKETVSE